MLAGGKRLSPTEPTGETGGPLAADAAAAIMWSRYCPGLRDTGMVSSATGFLDFISYGAAALSSVIFANAVSAIGWDNLILVWFALMAFGTVITIPKKNN